MAYNLGLKTKTFAGEVSILDSQHVRYIRGGVTIDSTKVSDGCNETVNGVVRKILKPGTFLAKLSNGKYCPAKITTLAQAAASTDTTLTLVNAKYFQAGDVIDVDGTQATIAANGVNYSTNVVTLTAAIGVAKSAGATVKATDGGTPACILPEEVAVTDEYGVTADQVTTGIDHGRVITARLPVAPVQAVKDALKEITFV
jgi:hypothetical protein